MLKLLLYCIFFLTSVNSQENSNTTLQVIIDRQDTDIFPINSTALCGKLKAYHHKEGFCKCLSGSPHFVSTSDGRPECFDNKHVQEEIGCNMKTVYKTKDDIINGRDSPIEWQCGSEINRFEYWQYNPETNVGSWKQSKLFENLFKFEVAGGKISFRVDYDERNWSGIIVRLVRQSSWGCNACKLVKFQGETTYPITEVIPKLFETTTTKTTSTTTTSTTTTSTSTTTTSTTASTTITSTLPSTETSTTSSTTQSTTTHSPLTSKMSSKQTPTKTSKTDVVSAVKDGDSGSMQTVGIAIGVVATLLVVVLIVVMVILRKRKSGNGYSNENIANIHADEPIYAEFDSNVDVNIVKAEWASYEPVQNGKKSEWASYEPVQNGKKHEWASYEPVQGDKNLDPDHSIIANQYNSYEQISGRGSLPIIKQYQELSPQYRNHKNVYKELEKPKVENPPPINDNPPPIYRELETDNITPATDCMDEDYYSDVITPPEKKEEHDDTYAQVFK